MIPEMEETTGLEEINEERKEEDRDENGPEDDTKEQAVGRKRGRPLGSKSSTFARGKRGKNLEYMVVRSFGREAEADAAFAPQRLSLMGLRQCRTNKGVKRIVRYYECVHEGCMYMCRVLYPDPALVPPYTIDVEEPLDRCHHDHSMSEQNGSVNEPGAPIIPSKKGLSEFQKEAIDLVLRTGQRTEPRLISALFRRMDIPIPSVSSLRNYIYYRKRKYRTDTGDGGDAVAAADTDFDGAGAMNAEERRQKLIEAIEAIKANRASWSMEPTPALIGEDGSAGAGAMTGNAAGMGIAAMLGKSQPALDAVGRLLPAGFGTARPVPMRRLDSLTTEELHKLVTRQGGGWAELARLVEEKSIDGLLLDGVESVEDLMGEDIGVERRLVANGILRRILLWKDAGVPAKLV